jgi:hypothetical protein
MILHGACKSLTSQHLRRASPECRITSPRFPGTLHSSGTGAEIFLVHQPRTKRLLIQVEVIIFLQDDEMNSTVVAPMKHPDTNGEVRLNHAEFWAFFDTQARNILGLSGDTALKRIRAGKAGSNLAWTDLVLLSSLLRDE